jgi:hypothetical protein
MHKPHKMVRKFFFLETSAGFLQPLLLNINGQNLARMPDQPGKHASIVAVAGGGVDRKIAWAKPEPHKRVGHFGESRETRHRSKRDLRRGVNYTLS